MIAKWQIMEPGEEVRTGRILRRDLAFAVVVEVCLAVLGCFSNPTREDTLSALGWDYLVRQSDSRLPL